MHSKHERLPTNLLILVSSSGFTGPAIAKANSYGIKTIAPTQLKQQIPVGRLGQPEEIARVVHFLAAGASSYITGQIWGVNGGMDM